VRRILLYAAAGLLPALGLLGTADQAQGQKAGRPPGAGLAKPAEGATCGDHGTNVHFYKSPSEAARAAIKEEKLVFVLHISGLFEDPDFT